MGARYLTNESGERIGVVLEIEEYERLKEAAEETNRTKHHPGVAFRGDKDSRRAWVVGTPFDVWELIELYQGKGKKRLFAEHPVTERQLEVALRYYEAFPEEIDSAIEENSRPPEYWMERYPELNWKT